MLIDSSPSTFARGSYILAVMTTTCAESDDTRLGVQPLSPSLGRSKRQRGPTDLVPPL